MAFGCLPLYKEAGPRLRSLHRRHIKSQPIVRMDGIGLQALEAQPVVITQQKMSYKVSRRNGSGKRTWFLLWPDTRSFQPERQAAYGTNSVHNGKPLSIGLQPAR